MTNDDKVFIISFMFNIMIILIGINIHQTDESSGTVALLIGTIILIFIVTRAVMTEWVRPLDYSGNKTSLLYKHFDQLLEIKEYKVMWIDKLSQRPVCSGTTVTGIKFENKYLMTDSKNYYKIPLL